MTQTKTDAILLNASLWCSQQKRYGILTAADVKRFASTLYSHTKTSHETAIWQLAPNEEFAMARFGNMTFAAVSLSSDDEKTFTEWVTKHNPDPVECLAQLTGDGFKVSCSWVFDQNSFCFSIIGTDNTKKHKECVMTSWSDDLAEVIVIGYYKHYIVCDADEWPTQADARRWG